ncbi:enamine deaminase RidA (YjgF/YER057c/UK114 family) [Volucribacter psittacicida]|uniref:Enamine deaminase RidA (YjgF/YER057c/UK114 family) n=1 Tax=Volucribacter psittacicida TaxID=203482 RepID=A0A4R1G2N6_9PAST|nr:RidA family protein [Volucribacter psittacicida]TCK02004.1 enamine deaminase RidA (YjgF/YER057c/UK114 family) [Volucribacter psittacicida]
MNIQRFQANSRLCEMTVYQGIAYLAGQVPEDTSADVYGQTQQVLRFIDELLASVGSDKRKILSAQIFLADMQDYERMNQAWDQWVDPHCPPARACVQAALANPEWKVEIVVIAAV